MYPSTFIGAVVVVVVVAAGQEGVPRVPGAVGRLLAGPHLGPHHLQQAAAHVVKHLKHLHNKHSSTFVQISKDNRIGH